MIFLGNSHFHEYSDYKCSSGLEQKQSGSVLGAPSSSYTFCMWAKMGSACCVASRDRTITNGSSSDAMPRNIRYSPSWSVRWDNRRRVAGEEASMNWFSNGVGTNDRLDNKSQTTAGTAYASEEGSPLESFRNLTWQKSSPSERRTVPQSGIFILLSNIYNIFWFLAWYSER